MKWDNETKQAKSNKTKPTRIPHKFGKHSSKRKRFTSGPAKTFGNIQTNTATNRKNQTKRIIQNFD